LIDGAVAVAMGSSLVDDATGRAGRYAAIAARAERAVGAGELRSMLAARGRHRRRQAEWPPARAVGRREPTSFGWEAGERPSP
jgi:hypothetical protein